MKKDNEKGKGQGKTIATHTNTWSIYQLTHKDTQSRDELKNGTTKKRNKLLLFSPALPISFSIS